jgi:hypothetical protein
LQSLFNKAPTKEDRSTRKEQADQVVGGADEYRRFRVLLLETTRNRRAGRAAHYQAGSMPRAGRQPDDCLPPVRGAGVGNRWMCPQGSDWQTLRPSSEISGWQHVSQRTLDQAGRRVFVHQVHLSGPLGDPNGKVQSRDPRVDWYGIVARVFGPDGKIECRVTHIGIDCGIGCPGGTRHLA